MSASIQELQKPPQCVDIEQSILAGCILFDEMREDALLYAEPDDFYATGHRLIFRAISEMADAGRPVDAQLLASYLHSKGLLEKAGGGLYIAKLLDAPVPSNTRAYVEQVRKHAQMRRIIQLCGKTIQTCQQSRVDDLEDVLNGFQASALSVGGRVPQTWITKEQLTKESVGRYQDLNEGGQHKSIPTGFPTLDRMTGGGFRGPKLVIIAARPRVGKTALMCNMIQHMCSKGVVCGCHSLEMDKAELDDRWISAGANVNSIRLSAEPGPDADEWKRIVRIADEQSRWPLMIDDTPASINDLKRRIRQMVKAGARIVFIDQLSGISGNRKKDAWERNSEHVEELKFLKKELRIPIVLLAQLNRDLEKRQNKKPILSDLKNTGQLEEDADIVLMGHRPALYAKNAQDREAWAEFAEWEIAKNRQGKEWNICMWWDEKHQVFCERAVF